MIVTSVVRCDQCGCTAAVTGFVVPPGWNRFRWKPGVVTRPDAEEFENRPYDTCSGPCFEKLTERMKGSSQR
jgi:hypothetical protein